MVPTGPYVLLKGCADDIVFGDAYYIETDSLRLFRIVRRAEREDRLKLIALLSDRYDELTVDRALICGLYRICGMFKMLY